jgi:hypothetical protein
MDRIFIIVVIVDGQNEEGNNDFVEFRRIAMDSFNELHAYTSYHHLLYSLSVYHAACNICPWSSGQKDCAFFSSSGSLFVVFFVSRCFYTLAPEHAYLQHEQQQQQQLIWSSPTPSQERSSSSIKLEVENVAEKRAPNCVVLRDDTMGDDRINTDSMMNDDGG